MTHFHQLGYPLTNGQRIALDSVLSEWPIDKEYEFDHILKLIKEGDESITAWEKVESWNEQTLCDFIEELADAIDHAQALL